MSYRYDGNGKFTDDNNTYRTKQSSGTRSDDPWASQPQKKPSNSDMGSWIFIAIMFAVAWPIGLIMLISKLSENDKKKQDARNRAAQTRSKVKSTVREKVDNVTRSPKDTDGTARVLKIVGICLAALGALVGLGMMTDIPYYIEYASGWEVFSDFSLAASFLAAGGGLLWGSGRMKRRMRRFTKYLAVAGASQSVSISRLAAAAEVSERRVERDLEIMIERGMWGEGAYVDLSAGKLFRNAAAGQQHYDQKYAPVTPPEAEQGYSGMLRQIRRANDRIADEVLSTKIDRLEEIAGRIFRIIENEPEKKAKASTFLSYYLPTTQKLLDSYAEFEEAGVSGGNLSEAKRKIERTMDNIVQGFERQLDELYRSDTLDIDSDIRVMETMLRRDTARVSDDFAVGKQKVQTSGGDVSDDFVAPDEGGEAPHEERTVVCRVELRELGAGEERKLEIVQALRAANGKTLKECLQMTESLPCVVLETGDVNAARALHNRLQELGAKASFSQTHTSVYRFR